ncbi:MAG: TlpA disulfide reductase family protein [Pseudomonadales bacterium]|jgi:peroxiredoxin|nr:TlpA disulfide reductase family protein [Pseudomonadales bacterium]
MHAWNRDVLRVATRTIASLMLVLSAGAAMAVEEGDAAPGFALQKPDGTTLKLDDLKGQPALVVFWSSTCPWCLRLLPGIQRTHERYGEAGLRVVGIGIRDAGDPIAYARELGLDFEFLLDGDAVAEAWGVQETPTWFVLDASGAVHYRSTDSDPDDPALDLVPAQLLGLDPYACGTAIC